MAQKTNIELPAAWRKFFSRFDEIDTIKPSQWKPIHCLSYICRRFRETFGTDFSIAIKGAPSKSYEIYQIKNIIATLSTSNMRTVKAYIDWVYDNKIIPKRTRIRKLGFFNTPGFANEFKFDNKQGSKIKRSTKLPDEYCRVAKALGITALTYGDLAFIQMADSEEYKVLFANLEAMGFDLEVLKEISE